MNVPDLQNIQQDELNGFAGDLEASGDGVEEYLDPTVAADLERACAQVSDASEALQTIRDVRAGLKGRGKGKGKSKGKPGTRSSADPQAAIRAKKAKGKCHVCGKMGQPTSRTSARDADGHTTNCALENFRRHMCIIRCTPSTTSCRPSAGTTSKIDSARKQPERYEKDGYMSHPKAIRCSRPLRPARADPRCTHSSSPGPMAARSASDSLAPPLTLSAVGEAASTVSLESVGSDSVHPWSPDHGA